MKNEIPMYLTVLDFNSGLVFLYGVEVNPTEGFDCEEYLDSVGHNVNDCHYMVHRSPDIERNNKELNK